MGYHQNGKMRKFQILSSTIFLIFLCLMIFVTTTAFIKKSGKTGLSMGKVQKMRYEATL